MLGLYVSDHPLFGVEAALRRKVEQSIAELAELGDGATVTIGGVVTGADPQVHQEGRPDGRVRARGPRGEHRGHAVPADAAWSTATSWPTTSSSPCAGRLDRRDEARINLICQSIEVLEGLESGPAPTLTLRLPPTSLDELTHPAPEADPARSPRRLGRDARPRQPGAAPRRRLPRRRRPLGRRAARGLRPRRRVALTPRPAARFRRTSLFGRLVGRTCRMAGSRPRAAGRRERELEWATEEGTWQSRCKRTIRRPSPTPTSTNWRRWTGRSASESCPRPRRTGSSPPSPASTASCTASRSRPSSASAARRAC